MASSKDVDAWFARYQNPMKDVVLRIRELILQADARIEECIKWQAPTFTFQGNLASFFPKSKQHASLMFHLGAHIPGDHPRLKGGGRTGRMMKIGSLAEAEAARADLKRIVRAWCDWRVSLAPVVPPARNRSEAAGAKLKGRVDRAGRASMKTRTPAKKLRAGGVSSRSGAGTKTAKTPAR